MLDGVSLEALKGKKNLLAFSGGVDSTALFFLLMEAGVEFDIAIVNYNTRESSKDEEEYAKELADIYGKKCFTLSVSPPEKNFEAEARRIRYGFFEKIIKEHSYHNLVTAHQLNDRLEWFLMRLAKGAGIRELAGPCGVDFRNSYSVVRPLLKTEKSQLYEYLKSRLIRYFEDESNVELRYERNRFREEFASPFLAQFAKGVRRSFDILERESKLFVTDFFVYERLIVFKSINKEIDGSNISKALKMQEYLISYKQRETALNGYDSVVGGKFAITKNKKGLIFVSPYLRALLLQDRQKEIFRAALIPPKHRQYIVSITDDPCVIINELEGFFSL